MTRTRRFVATVAAMVLAGAPIAGCGGDDDDDADSGIAADGVTDDDSGDDAADDDFDDDFDDEFSDQEITGQDPDFDLATLPDSFPDELVPPAWDTGQYSEVTGFPSASFESSASFDELVAHYDGTLGQSIIVGDPGEMLATWSQSPPWAVSVFDGDVRLVVLTEIPQG